ncbi:ankyrin repeat domain-containing protein, partial [Legionella sainthelensi]
QMNEYSIPQTTLEKFNQAIKRDYQHYVNFCNLLKNRKVNIVHSTSDSNFTKIENHSIIDNSQPKCDIYKGRVMIHPPIIRSSSLMIPRRCFQHDNLYWGLISSETELLYYIANSRTNTALRYINEGDYINDYNMVFGDTPILLALCKGWNHLEPKKHPYTQRAIIEALLAKKSLEVNCIHLRNGMTPLHIACLRGDSPDLIKALLKRGADCTALDYKGRRPVEMLNIDNVERQEIIGELSGSSGNSSRVFKQYDQPSKNLVTAKIPTSQERKQSILNIRFLLAKSSVQQLIPSF